MKTFKNSILFYSIESKTDICSCFFIFYLGWFKFKIQEHKFDLKQINLRIIVEFYNNLSNDWTKKYTI